MYVSKYSEDLASDSRQAAQEAINERTKALEKQGLTFDYLAKKLKRELNAKETKFFQKDGFVKEQHDVVAWDIRQRARIDAHKLRGDYPAEKREITGKNGGPIEHEHTIHKELAERLEDME